MKDLKMLGGIILMKNFFKVLTLGLLLTVFAAVNVTTTFAQDPQAEKTAIYNKYMENYKGNISQRKAAIAAAKEYIEKYRDSEVDGEQVKYFNSAIPQLEAGIQKEEKAATAAAASAASAEAKQKLYKDFDTAARGANWDQVYALGKQILADNPDQLDVTLVLGSIGLDESVKTPANKKYNTDTITYANLAIDKLNAGKTSDNFGAYGKYEYKTKENALGWMNWTIGNILYFHTDGKEKDALPYLYQAAKYNSDVKDFPEIYRAMGRWYLNKVVEMEKVRNAKLAAADNVDTPETLALLAQNKGYAARAIDAYSRAYKLAKDNPKTLKEYKDNIFGKLQELYKFRYDEDTMKTDAKINSDVAVIMNKPLPNPNAPVEPIEKQKPAVDGTETTDASTTTTAPTTNGAERSRTVKSTNTATKPATKPTTQNKPRQR
jgi:hypothetical protein